MIPFPKKPVQLSQNADFKNIIFAAKLGSICSVL